MFRRRLLVDLDRKTISHRRALFAGKRKYYLSEYADIILPAVSTMRHMTWREATQKYMDPIDEVLVVRHDIDHDIENAVRLARWEKQHGISTTYCVLHTAWYYGEMAGRKRSRTSLLVESCLEMQELGHEINLHNNTIVEALHLKRDPYDLLEQELGFLRSKGIDVVGTSTHGDALCRALNFRNFELFSESVYASRGGARSVTLKNHSVDIGVRSMREFGLQYEGYDLPRDVYITDSGGRLRVKFDTRGRAGLRRRQCADAIPFKKIIGILTHPIWWDLESSTPSGRPSIKLSTLLESGVPDDS